MKIAMIIGSPKPGKNASRPLADQLAQMLGSQHEYCYITGSKKVLSESELQSIAAAETVVLSFPLYVDAIPSHFLQLLCQLENYFHATQANALPKIYAIVNCGFFEAKQNQYALEILEHWCHRSGLTWGMGIGIGAGPMISQFAGTPGKGVKKQVGAAYAALAAAILQKQTADNRFAEPDFPKQLYLKIVHFGWRTEARRNGLKSRDLYRRTIEQ